MKILFLSYTYWPPDFGGALIRTVQTMQSLARRGHEVTVLTSGAPSYPQRERSCDGYLIFRSPAIGRSRLQRGARRLVCFFWMLYKLIQVQYDVVHISSLPGVGFATSRLMGYIIVLVVRLKGARTVFTYTLADTDYDLITFCGLQGCLKRNFLNSVSSLVGISPALYDALQTAFPKKRVSLIVNGVRDDIFHPLSIYECSRVRSTLGFDEQSVVFTFLGSVAYRKGFDILAEAFCTLSREHPNWYLLVIGPHAHQENTNISDTEFNELTALIHNNPRVVFLGRVDDRSRLSEYLGASDVFVFPSRREGLGNAPLEAMSAGVPVIIARLPGITDLANIHEQTGLYIEPDNVGQLKEAMRRLGEDPALRQSMGQAARRRIEEAFSWEQYVSRWEQLYTNGNVSSEELNKTSTQSP